MPFCHMITHESEYEMSASNERMRAAIFIYNMLFQFSRLVSSTAAKLQDLMQSGVKKHEAWNQCTVQLAQAAKVSKIYLLLWRLSS